MQMAINIEWIGHMKSYRLYNSRKPDKTIAYKESVETAEKRAKEEGYDNIVMCDTDTMHVG